MVNLITIFSILWIELGWLIKFIVLFLIFTMLIATITLIERKVLALTQRRVGPNYVGYRGRLQFIADAIKLIGKHITIVSRINKLLFLIIPCCILVCVYLFWANLIWAPNLAICEIEYNFVFMGLLSGLLSILLILVGYNTKNKYAMLSSSRVILMSFSLELLITFMFIVLATITNSLALSYLPNVGIQLGNFIYLGLLIPFVLIILLVETNRTPFDLAEAESELIAGYTTEYSGFYFVLFYLGEYFHLFCSCVFFATAFINGWGIH